MLTIREYKQAATLEEALAAEPEAVLTACLAVCCGCA